MTTVYDVCNDYSLAKASEVPAAGAVTWIEKEVVIHGEKIMGAELGYSKDHKELIYLRTDVTEDLQGKILSL